MKLVITILAVTSLVALELCGKILPWDAITLGFGIVLAYLIAQGLSDVGKGKAQERQKMMGTGAKGALRYLVTSKKFLVTVATLVTIVSLHLLGKIAVGIALSFSFYLIIAYLLAQGLADLGKGSYE